jgi:hypothetical protein
MEASPFPLSSRAKPRDLRFYGPVLEMFFDSVGPMWRRPEQARTKQRPGDDAPGARSGL